MNELPTPMLPLSPVPLPRGPHARFDSVVAQTGRGGISVAWARHQDEVRQAQRLRFRVFSGEMGARLGKGIPGHDVDLFDDYCEHLLVRDADTDEVIGTYRVLTPAQARRVGSTYSDYRIRPDAPARPARAHGRAWAQLRASRSSARRRDPGIVGGAGRVHVAQPIRHDGRLRQHSRCCTTESPAATPPPASGTRSSARTWRGSNTTFGRGCRCPWNELDGSLAIEPPALIAGYLRAGAKVLGPPAWDPDFNTADLPLLLRFADLPPRYRKHFLGA